MCVFCVRPEESSQELQNPSSYKIIKLKGQLMLKFTIKRELMITQARGSQV
ncbi:hypothetical protein HanIR_Chr15g0755841 [Helianthus annuus]|nr:hypothetical protein HanIR_Chr15g0755841 [Helianthus annuus]